MARTAMRSCGTIAATIAVLITVIQIDTSGSVVHAQLTQVSGPTEPTKLADGNDDSKAKGMSMLLRAKAVAGNIMDEARMAAPLAAIAAAYIDAGDSKSALQVADVIKNSQHKLEIYRRIAIAQAELGHAGTSRRTFKLIDERFTTERVEVLCQIAVGLEGAAKHYDAVSVVFQAEKLVSGLKQTDVGRILALRSLAWAQAKVGDVPGALRTVDLIGRAPDDRDTVRIFFNQSLACVVQAQVAKGDFDVALRTNGLMRQPAEMYSENVLVEIASAASQKRNFKHARTHVEMISQSKEKCRALAAIAAGQFGNGNFIDAKWTLDEAYWIASTAQATVDKVMGLGIVAITQANIGDFDGARKTAEKLQELESKGSGVGFYSSALVEIGKSQAKENKADDARRTLSLALQITLGSKQINHRTFQAIAEAQVTNGDYERAITWSNQLALDESKAYALLGIAEGLLKRSKMNGVNQPKK